jgi:very-short-patch-repair endonuclease
VRGELRGLGVEPTTSLVIDGVSGVVLVEERDDAAVARIAAAQHGVVSRAQLVAVGLGRSAIAHRLSNARLHRVHRGVYLVGHPVPTRFGPHAAALLSCGDGAVLSHQTAAALWGFADDQGPGIDVTVAGRDCGTRTGIRAHRVRRLHPSDRTRKSLLPITAPTRTLLDLAEAVPQRHLERAIAEALVRRLTTEAKLERLLEGSPGRRGSRALRSLLDQAKGPALTRSEAERHLLALVRAGNLSPPETNARLGPYEVDFLWRQARLIVEVDGYAFHSSRTAFERDRARDAELQRGGYGVLRVTWRQLTEQPHAVLVQIAQLLAMHRR